MKQYSTVCLYSLIASACLAGCSSALPYSPQDTLALEPKLDSMQSATVDGSARLFKGMDALRTKIELSVPAATQVPPPPVDPLTIQKISISMQDTRIGPVLWILAREFGLSLSVEPAVLAMPQVANLHLQELTGRQALNQIFSVFDIAGNVSEDKILSVALQEEKVFYLDTLTGKSFIDVSVGGDVFGSGGRQGGTSLKDSLTLGGSFGERTEGVEQFSKLIEAALADNGVGRDKARFGIDSAGGTLYVKASPSRVSAVKKLLDKSNDFRSRQVQIEAQLVDVQLSEGSQLGIDWTLLNSRLAGRLGAEPASLLSSSAALADLKLNARTLTIPAQSVGSSGGLGVLAEAGGGFTAAINALRTFGAVKVLSNPTIRVRNGVPAVLSVGNSVRYVQKITTSTSYNSTTTTPGTTPIMAMDVQTDSVFSGVVVGISALVKSDGTVELFVRPSQTEVQEKSLALVDVGSGNKVTLPIINTKSIATTLNMRSGETVVIGGLINQQLSGNGAGIPGFSELPVLGRIFGNTGDAQTGREMVMVLRVKVI